MNVVSRGARGIKTWHDQELRSLNAPAPDSIEPTVPRQWAQAVVSESLHCRTCGYDLRGLAANSRCPECGKEIWASVLHTVDPAASRLPSLRNPRAVGNSLLWLTGCTLIGTLLWAAPKLARAIDSLDPGRLRSLAEVVPSLTWPYAAALLIVGGWAIWTLAPPRGSEPRGAVWTDIWRIAIGYIGWLVLACASLELVSGMTLTPLRQRLLLQLASGVFAIFGLIGLRSVFRVIGQRSRAYRRSRGGKQSIDLIIMAIAVGLIAATVRHLSNESWVSVAWRYRLETLSKMVMGICIFMVVVGLAYLVGNALWIRSSLRRPPPPLDQVLLPRVAGGGAGDARIGDRED